MMPPKMKTGTVDETSLVAEAVSPDEVAVAVSQSQIDRGPANATDIDILPNKCLITGTHQHRLFRIRKLLVSQSTLVIGRRQNSAFHVSWQFGILVGRRPLTHSGKFLNLSVFQSSPQSIRACADCLNKITNLRSI